MKTVLSTVSALIVLAMSASTAFPAPFAQLADQHMSHALQLLATARSEVQQASSVNAGGEKAQAIQAINAAIAHLKMAEKKDYKKDQKHDKKHPSGDSA